MVGGSKTHSWVGLIDLFYNKRVTAFMQIVDIQSILFNLLFFKTEQCYNKTVFLKIVSKNMI